MKKTKILFAMALMTLSLVGCNENNNGTTSANGNDPTTDSIPTTGNNPTTGTNSTGGTSSAYATWTSDEISYMTTAIGETLPEGPFSNNRKSEGYTDEYDGAYTFYMFDSGINDVSNEYARILENNNYTSDGSDDSQEMTYYFYYKPVSNSETDYIYIQFGYYPGSDEYVAGFDLYAWIYSESSSDDDFDFGFDTYTSWPEDIVDSFLNGATSIPEIEGSEFLVYVDEDEYGEYLFMSINTGSNIEESYTATLTAAGWNVDDSDYEESGYVAISKNEDVLLQYYYDDAFIMFISL